MNLIITGCSLSLMVLGAALARGADRQEFFTPAQDLPELQTSRSRDARLPDVLIIGDSISIGYMKAVREGLLGKANVLRPDTNCGNTLKGLENLDAWLGSAKWDVIHFNFGLHDLCFRSPQSTLAGNRDKVRGTRDVAPEDYRKNLEKIVARLEQTGARLIFATTTVVPPDEAGRIEGDEVIYNRIATGVMRKHHIPTDDLYTLTKRFDKHLFAGPGDVHYQPVGYKVLGAQVAKSIEALLPPPRRAHDH